MKKLHAAENRGRGGSGRVKRRATKLIFFDTTTTDILSEMVERPYNWHAGVYMRGLRLVLTVSGCLANEALICTEAEAATSGCAEHEEGHALPPPTKSSIKEAVGVAECNTNEVLLLPTAACKTETTTAGELQGAPICDEQRRMIKRLKGIDSIGDAPITLSDAQGARCREMHRVRASQQHVAVAKANESLRVLQ